MVGWMLVVYVMSTDLGSVTHTGQFLVPFLRWLNPSITFDTIEQIHLILRKAGHVTEYAILALLIVRAIRLLRPGILWWPTSLLAFGLSSAYALTDELHQTFVASRGPSLADVAIDAAGAVCGIVWMYLRHQRRAAEEPA